jgi:hypothetical protein
VTSSLAAFPENSASDLSPEAHRVSARQLLLAVPDAERDIYVLHQRVWEQLDASLEIRTQPPDILYRRHRGCITVRVSGVPLRHGLLDSLATEPGQVRRFSLQCALWRDLGRRRQSPLAKLRELLDNAGCRLLDHRITMWVASGHKSRIGSDIHLPVADVHGALLVVDQQRLHDAWRLGIGRGRRFGFGMLVLQP